MAEKKGKKLRRCSKYAAYYASQYDETYRNKRKKIKREIERLVKRESDAAWIRKHPIPKDYTRAIDLWEQALLDLDAQFMANRGRKMG